jgi:hypothetical protein
MRNTRPITPGLRGKDGKKVYRRTGDVMRAVRAEMGRFSPHVFAFCAICNVEGPRVDNLLPAHHGVQR